MVFFTWFNNLLCVRREEINSIQWWFKITLIFLVLIDDVRGKLYDQQTNELCSASVTREVTNMLRKVFFCKFRSHQNKNQLRISESYWKSHYVDLKHRKTSLRLPYKSHLNERRVCVQVKEILLNLVFTCHRKKNIRAYFLFYFVFVFRVFYTCQILNYKSNYF